MNRDDALRKIQRCLEMAKSSSQYEAAAAMRQAQALMREFGVSEGDVELLAVTEVSIASLTNASVVWEAALNRLIASAFGCEVYWRRSYGDDFRLVRHTVFVGIGAAPQVAAYAYEVLGRQCVKARRAYIASQSKRCKPATKTARGDEFARGWVQSVRDLVQNMAMSPANAELVERYMEQQHPDLITAQVRDRGSRVAHQGHAAAGFRAGKSARLGRGVGGPAARPLLGRS